MRILIPVILATLTLTGCNTVQGVGRDIQGAGTAVEKGAKKAKDAITD